MTRTWRKFTLCHRKDSRVALCLRHRWHRGDCQGFGAWIDCCRPLTSATVGSKGQQVLWQIRQRVD